MFGRRRNTTPPRSPASGKRGWVLQFEGGRFDGFNALLPLPPDEQPRHEVRLWDDAETGEPAVTFPEAYDRIKVPSVLYVRVGCRDTYEAWAAYRAVRDVDELDEDLARALIPTGRV